MVLGYIRILESRREGNTSIFVPTGKGGLVCFFEAIDAFIGSIPVGNKSLLVAFPNAMQVLDVSITSGQGKKCGDGIGPLPLEEVFSPLLAGGLNSSVDKEDHGTFLQQEDSPFVEPARNLLSHEEQMLIDGLLNQTMRVEASNWKDSIQPELDLMLTNDNVEEQAGGDFQK